MKKSQKDNPDFIYADFFFGFEKKGMHKKISQAIEMLRDGQTISIKAFDIYVERAIKMCEILKFRVSPLYQETLLIKYSKKRESE